MKSTLIVAAALLSLAQGARAGELSKEECVQAYSRGQDAKEQTKISLARKLFLTCAQPSCPQLVQADCARFVNDLGRLQPTVSFAARDAGGADLPDTTVYVDDALVLTQLDDGAPHDLDPGKHVIRFSNAGRDKTITVVIQTGEKGRAIVARFPGGAAASGSASGHALALHAEPHATKHTTHPGGAKVALVAGAVLVAGGVTLAVAGLTSLPGGCSLSSNTCGAPPGDPVFGRASSSATLLDDGIAVGVVGAAVLVGGIVWFAQGARTTTEHDTVAMPWATPTSAGFAVSGQF